MNVIKLYIYGYLNVYYVNYYGLLSKSHTTYKEFKVLKLASYLNLSAWTKKMVIKFLNIIIWFEVPFSLLLVSFRFLKSFGKCLVTPFKKIENQYLLLGAGEVKTKQLLEETDLDNIRVVTIPYITNKIYQGLDIISIYSGIVLNDVIKSYYKAICTIIIIYKKYRTRDFLTRSYSSFEYYLAYYYTQRSCASNVYIFTSTYSKWAFLHGYLQHKTIFLQHGWLSNESINLLKIGSANAAYYISEQQKHVCEGLLFNNKPEAHYLKGIKFNIIPDKTKINILLVCESGFRRKELKIIEEIAKNKDLRLFVKPHPKDKDIEVFENLKEECGLIILQGYNFPAVDYVISYESTLAIEYEMKGVTTLVYDRDEYEEEYRRLLSMKVHHD